MDRPDLAWKLLLHRRLRAVLARLFPAIYAQIDWSRPYFLPDKSLPPATANSRTSDREPDFIALVTLLDGAAACLHVEIQCARQAGFGDRMALYHARLHDRFDMPVISLAILGDPSPTWRPQTSTDNCGMTFQFDAVKLLDFRDELDTLRQTLDPVSICLAAHLIALSTRHKPELRCAAKLGLLLPLYPLRGKLRELTDIQDVIDWLLPLPPFWQRRMSMDVEKFLEEHKKQDKNSLNYIIAEHFIQQGIADGLPKGEAIGRAKGEAIGRAKGEEIGRVKGEEIGRVKGEEIGRTKGEEIGRAKGEEIGRVKGEEIGRAKGEEIGRAKGEEIGLVKGQEIGRARGEALGLAKGATKGRADILKLQLDVRFGPLSAGVRCAFGRASPEQLERLAIALLDAE